MNSRRTLLIAVALVLAALAFIGNVYYLNTAQQRANEDATLVQVFVVKKQVAKGVPGEIAISQDLVGTGKIPQQFRPGSSVAKLDDIKGKVAINDLSPGQVLVDGQFVDQSVAQVTNAQRVPAGQVAVTISVDRIHGVAGLLLPGDKVNMLVAEKRNDGDTRVQTLYQNANILAIGTKAAAQAGETTEAKSNDSAAAAAAADSGLITFALPLEAAQRVALIQSAQDKFTFYLTLVQPDNQPVAKPGAVDTGGVFNGTGQSPYPNE